MLIFVVTLSRNALIMNGYLFIKSLIGLGFFISRSILVRIKSEFLNIIPA